MSESAPEYASGPPATCNDCGADLFDRRYRKCGACLEKIGVRRIEPPTPKSASTGELLGPERLAEIRHALMPLVWAGDQRSAAQENAIRAEWSAYRDDLVAEIERLSDEHREMAMRAAMGEQALLAASAERDTALAGQATAREWVRALLGGDGLIRAAARAYIEQPASATVVTYEAVCAELGETRTLATQMARERDAALASLASLLGSLTKHGRCRICLDIEIDGATPKPLIHHDWCPLRGVQVPERGRALLAEVDRLAAERDALAAHLVEFHGCKAPPSLAGQPSDSEAAP